MCRPLRNYQSVRIVVVTKQVVNTECVAKCGKYIMSPVFKSRIERTYRLVCWATVLSGSESRRLHSPTAPNFSPMALNATYINLLNPFNSKAKLVPASISVCPCKNYSTFFINAEHSLTI